MWWSTSSSSSSHESVHRRMTEIVKSSTFGNNDKKTNNFLWIGETSYSSRVVIDAQGNFAKDRRMVCSSRSLSSQEWRARVCGPDCSKQPKTADESIAAPGHVK
jgi:hypothetical protein